MKRELPPTTPGLTAGEWVAQLPDRLRRLLWLLCVNGGLVGLEGILQRLSGVDKLLWLAQPRFNDTADTQFGPYAYRANAAQYLNLIWPVCLGFWWSLRRWERQSSRVSRRAGSSPHVVLVPCAILMAISPVISTTRGGAAVAALQLLAVLAVLTFADRRGRWLRHLATLAVFALSIGLGFYLGWSKFEERLANGTRDVSSGRADIYRNSVQMARDFPVFGSGPGSFPALYQLYRHDFNQDWEAYLHNDWMQTVVTFGGIGSAMVLLALLLAPAHWFLHRGIPVPWVMMATIWIAMSGCLLHAFFDFPFQIYSIAFLFLLLACVSFSARRA